jgi:hypothetical protein
MCPAAIARKRAHDKAWQRSHYLRRTRKPGRARTRIKNYDNLVSVAGEICAICNKSRGKQRLNIDHCHVTGKTRGLLCAGCNRGIGFFDDDTNRLSKAIAYLEKFRRPATQDGIRCRSFRA